jgi:hypothetical protein
VGGLNENKAKLSPPAEAGTGAWLSLAKSRWEKTVNIVQPSIPQKNDAKFENPRTNIV